MNVSIVSYFWKTMAWNMFLSGGMAFLDFLLGTRVESC